MKAMGVVAVLDNEAFSSNLVLGKLNVALCIFWAARMTVITPKTYRRETPRLDSGDISFEDITEVADELDCAFYRLEGLMRSTRGRRLMTVHRNGAVTTEGPARRPSLPDVHLLQGRGDRHPGLPAVMISYLQWFLN